MTIDAAHIERWMRECIALAQRGGRAVDPNPQVGAIVVRDGVIIGRGWHKVHGGPHAEVHALQAAGSGARGATLIVTLEPCNHTGKTPPCTEAILNAGIRHVVIGMRDPNPDVAGHGIDRLEAAGVTCDCGVLEREVRAINERFLTNVEHRRPYVLLKIAQTLDGFIAPQRGTSRWITSAESRAVAHELRAQHDGILVGAGTVRKDDPSLTVRDATGPSPRRVILTSTLDLPQRAVVLNDADRERTIVVTSSRAVREHGAEAERIRRRGVEILEMRAGSKGLLPLAAVMHALYERDIRSLLVEGGAAVYSQFLREGLANRMDLFIAPKIIGAGESAFSSIRPVHMADAHHWTIVDTVRRGDDVHLTLVPPSAD